MKLPSPNRWASVVLLAVALPFVAPEARAQGSHRSVALAEALAAASTNGPRVAAARGAERAAGGRALSTRGTFDTTLGAGLSARSSATPGVRDSDFVAGFDRRIGGQVRAARALETGGAVSVALGQQRTETSIATQGGTLGGLTTFDSAASATLVHPLLRGFGLSASLAPRRAADERWEAAGALLAQARLEAQLDAAVAYVQLVSARDELGLRREATALNRVQIASVRALVVGGRAAEGDVAAVERSLRLREADELAVGAEVTARTADLLRTMGVELRQILESQVVPADGLPAPRRRALATLAPLTLAQNPTLKASRAQLRAAGYEATFAGNQTLVRLDLTASVSLAGRDPSVGASAAQVFTGTAPGYLFGLDLTIPIENRAARGAAEASRGEHDRGLAELRDQEREICVALVRASAVQRAASDRIDLALAAARAAEETLRLEEQRMLAGRSSASDVLLRQQELLDARLIALRARTDAALADATIDALSGAFEDPSGSR